ncbi:MAG TPA: DUF4388 domain-containing protein [Thermoanaerobaculia bacterium]|nr:DUF4388 domain-containing protein [Thermoanaerobaculia bacterium]
MAIEGSLDVFHLPEILQMVSMQKRTGILTVQGENDIVAVSFKAGQVVAADALNQTVEDGLGQVLASQGLVSPHDFSAVVAEHERAGRRLLDVLLERGLVDRGQLLDALRLQTYRLLLQLLRWEQGEFKFYAGDEVAYEEGFYAISVEELLIRSVADLGEEGIGLPSADAVYERAAGGPPIRFVGEDGEGSLVDSGAVWLAPEERQLLESLDGRRTAAQIAAGTSLGEYQVLFSLYRLLRAGSVRQVQAARAAASARVPAPAAGAAPVPIGTPAAGPQRVVAMASRGAAALAPNEALDVADVGAVESESAAPDGAAPVRTRAVPASWAASLTAALALVAGTAAFALAWQAPWRVLLPFRWQEEVREVFAHHQRQAQFQHLDKAARTYFLLEGHYPDELRELAEMSLLSSRELRDPRGRRLAYSHQDVSYQITPVAAGAPLEELGVRESIVGDFLLDPEFLQLTGGPETAPLVLLD